MMTSKTQGADTSGFASNITRGWSVYSQSTNVNASSIASGYTSDPNATTFPSAPNVSPTKREYVRMYSFISLYLLVVLGLLAGVWVIQEPHLWQNRLILTVVCISSAVFRVLLGSWLLKAAGARLALIFVEVDILALSVVGFFVLVAPTSFTIKALQTDLAYSSLSTELFGIIVTGATIKEVGKFLCYIVPFLLGQIECVSHLLFTGIIAGAMGMLYTDILTNTDISITWSRFTVSVLYTMLYTLWTSMGCTIVCLMAQRRISKWFSPLVLVVPILFHAGYLLAISGQDFDWKWALITVSYWIVSAVVLKLMLAPVMPLDALFRERYAPSTVMVAISEERHEESTAV
jgi:hypothetical protein